jgi:hypothetical protein
MLARLHKSRRDTNPCSFFVGAAGGFFVPRAQWWRNLSAPLLEWHGLPRIAPSLVRIRDVVRDSLGDRWGECGSPWPPWRAGRFKAKRSPSSPYVRSWHSFPAWHAGGLSVSLCTRSWFALPTSTNQQPPNQKLALSQRRDTPGQCSRCFGPCLLG